MTVVVHSPTNMRDLDIGRFLRLRNAVQQAASAIPADSSGTSGRALPEAYKRFREEALAIVPKEHREQFEQVCPEWTTSLGGSRAEDPFIQSQFYNEARVLMGGLAGFLDGYVDETRLRIEAEERAALEAERSGQYL